MPNDGRRRQINFGEKLQPHVVKTVLGWSVVGTVKENCNGDCHINFKKKLHDLINQQIECLWRMDKVNAPSSPSQRAMSKEDRYALDTIQKSKRIVGGHYKLAYPGVPELRN